MALAQKGACRRRIAGQTVGFVIAEDQPPRTVGKAKVDDTLYQDLLLTQRCGIVGIGREGSGGEEEVEAALTQDPFCIGQFRIEGGAEEGGEFIGAQQLSHAWGDEAGLNQALCFGRDALRRGIGGAAGKVAELQENVGCGAALGGRLSRRLCKAIKEGRALAQFGQNDGLFDAVGQRRFVQQGGGEPRDRKLGRKLSEVSIGVDKRKAGAQGFCDLGDLRIVRYGRCLGDCRGERGER